MREYNRHIYPSYSRFWEYLDSREQGCASLHAMLDQAAKGESGDLKDALIEMRDYVNEHFSECAFDLGAEEYPLNWVGGSIIFSGDWYIDTDWTQADLADD